MRDVDEAKAIMSDLKGLGRGRIDLVTMPSPGMEPLTTFLTRIRPRPPRPDCERRSRLHPGGGIDPGANWLRRSRRARVRRTHGCRRPERGVVGTSSVGVDL